MKMIIMTYLTKRGILYMIKYKYYTTVFRDKKMGYEIKIDTYDVENIFNIEVGEGLYFLIRKQRGDIYDSKGTEVLL